MVLSQDEPKPNSIKLEAGLGGTIAGHGAGLSGRLAIGFISHKWGIMIRSTAGDGGDGPKINNSGFGPGDHLIESFNDKAILASRVISKPNGKPQVIASLGFGSFTGRKLNESKKELIHFDKTIGLAFELGTATNGHAFGLSSRLFGNINKEAIYLGVAFSVALDLRW
jgi:hypothetical protein